MDKDMWGDEAGPRSREQFIVAMCSLASDVNGCVRLPDPDDRGIHYGCVCEPTRGLKYEDVDGNMVEWDTVDSAIIDFIHMAVHNAISAHQETWEDDE